MEGLRVLWHPGESIPVLNGGSNGNHERDYSIFFYGFDDERSIFGPIEHKGLWTTPAIPPSLTPPRLFGFLIGRCNAVQVPLSLKTRLRVVPSDRVAMASIEAFKVC